MFTITRDGQPIETVATESDVLAWFRYHVRCSRIEAVLYGGYAVQDETGNRVAV